MIHTWTYLHVILEKQDKETVLKWEMAGGGAVWGGKRG